MRESLQEAAPEPSAPMDEAQAPVYLIDLEELEGLNFSFLQAQEVERQGCYVIQKSAAATSDQTSASTSTSTSTSGVPLISNALASSTVLTAASRGKLQSSHEKNVTGPPLQISKQRKVSTIWNHFERCTKDKLAATCCYCRRKVRVGKPGGDTRTTGTTALHNHMKRNHAHLVTNPRKAAAKDMSLEVQQSATELKNQKKVQPTLQEALDRKMIWEPTHALAMLHCQKLAEFLAVSMKPFSMVEDPAFLKFMHYCVPKWKIPGRKHFASSVVPGLEAAIREALKKELKLSVGGTVHLTTDIWSSRQVTDYMSVTAHWMIHDHQGCLSRQKAVVDMASFGQTHTAENIAEKLDFVMKSWLPPLGLEPGYVTTDNAQNVVRALRDANMKRIPCMAHCLNLVVKGGLTKAGPAVEEALKTSRAICGHFHHSATKTSKLAEVQRRQNLPQHQLLQDVPTRWNSTLYMVERLCEQRRAVTEFFEDSSKHHLTPEQWTLLKTLITVLRPFEEATRLVCMNDATLSQVLPLLKFIERSLERMASQEGASGTAQLAASLLTALHSNRHLNNIKEDIVYWAASFLDPRFRNTFGNYTEDQAASKLKRTQEHLIRQIEETMDAHNDSITTETSLQMSAQPCSTSVQAVTPPPPGEFSLWFSSSDEMGLTQSQAQPGHAPPQLSLAAKAELDAYTQDREADSYGVQSDPVEYWATKKKQWPSLFVIAVKHLACPPTSVYSEQAFSAAGMIVTERRNRLSTKNVGMLAFIRMNRAWIDKTASPTTSMLEQDVVSSESDDEDEEPLLKRVHFEDA